MNKQLKDAKQTLKDAADHLELCRNMIEQWMAKEQRAFEDYLEMEKVVNELRLSRRRK